MKSTHNDFRGHNLLFQEVQVCRRCSYNTLMGSLMVFWGVGVIWLLTSKKKSTIITDLCKIVSIRLYSLWMRLYCMTISADTIKHYQICLYISVKSFTSQYWPEGIGILLKIHHLSSFPSFQAFQSDDSPGAPDCHRRFLRSYQGQGQHFPGKLASEVLQRTSRWVLGVFRAGLGGRMIFWMAVWLKTRI